LIFGCLLEHDRDSFGIDSLSYTIQILDTDSQSTETDKQEKKIRQNKFTKSNYTAFVIDHKNNDNFCLGLTV
jgi:hypothetical protein